MALYKNKFRTESVRLRDWDYSSNGCYFITICTKHRIPYFGKIRNGTMKFSESGKLAYKYWKEIPNHFPFSRLDEFVIMPNHVHGIIVIDNHGDAINRVSTISGCGGITGIRNPMFYQSISKIIRWYKGRCTFEINKNIGKIFQWQPRYYDHIIRDNNEMCRIQTYIQNNPDKWTEDNFYNP